VTGHEQRVDLVAGVHDPAEVVVAVAEAAPLLPRVLHRARLVLRRRQCRPPDVAVRQHGQRPFEGSSGGLEYLHDADETRNRDGSYTYNGSLTEAAAI
jgi:hypothetical protein